MKIIEEKFDVVVIGGGPAGMMAAGRAAELGARVALLEKNKSLGKKLLMTGNGRCNLTQANCSDIDFIKKLNNKNSKFFFSSLASFGVEDIRTFFEKRGVATKVEKNGKVFPISDKAQDVMGALAEYLRTNGVTIFFESQVKSFEVDFEHGVRKISAVNLFERKIYADSFILATGGKSYAATGSTGDGYTWAREFGHNVILPKPGLAPVRIKEDWTKKFQGVSLKHARVAVWQNKKKCFAEEGGIIFTHFGLSGPAILNISSKISKLIENNNEIMIEIDLAPEKTFEQLDDELRMDFLNNANKDFKNYLAEKLSPKLSKGITDILEIEEKKKNNNITRDERLRLGRALKSLCMTVDSVVGFEQAMITCGGVDLREVDAKTMQSKLIGNLFFAGEILDLDGPTGGYNLQICWSTGFVAGSAGAK